MGEAIFKSDTFGTLTLEEVISAIAGFVRANPDFYYKISVGSDSKGESIVPIINTVTVRRVGRGAIIFRTSSAVKRYATLRDRIWDEAMQSLTLGQEIRARLKDALSDEFFWDSNEIHVDIGQNGPTRDFVEGITGMIRGMDFIPVTKPYAYCASVVADRYT
jgi:hypothetical protein